MLPTSGADNVQDAAHMLGISSSSSFEFLLLAAEHQRPEMTLTTRTIGGRQLTALSPELNRTPISALRSATMNPSSSPTSNPSPTKQWPSTTTYHATTKMTTTSCTPSLANIQASPLLPNSAAPFSPVLQSTNVPLFPFSPQQTTRAPSVHNPTESSFMSSAPPASAQSTQELGAKESQKTHEHRTHHPAAQSFRETSRAAISAVSLPSTSQSVLNSLPESSGVTEKKKSERTKKHKKRRHKKSAHTSTSKSTSKRSKRSVSKSSTELDSAPPSELEPETSSSLTDKATKRTSSVRHPQKRPNASAAQTHVAHSDTVASTQISAQSIGSSSQPPANPSRSLASPRRLPLRLPLPDPQTLQFLEDLYVQRFAELQQIYQAPLAALIEELANTLTTCLSSRSSLATTPRQPEGVRAEDASDAPSRLHVVYRQMLQAMQVLDEGRRAQAGQLLYFDLAQLEYQLKVWLSQRVHMSDRDTSGTDMPTAVLCSAALPMLAVAQPPDSTAQPDGVESVHTPSRATRPLRAERTLRTPQTPKTGAGRARTARGSASSGTLLRTPTRQPSTRISGGLALLSPLSPLRMRTQPCFTPQLQRKRRLSETQELPRRRILDSEDPSP